MTKETFKILLKMLPKEDKQELFAEVLKRHASLRRIKELVEQPMQETPLLQRHHFKKLHEVVKTIPLGEQTKTIPDALEKKKLFAFLCTLDTMNATHEGNPA
jgi:hypothetical protein